MSSFLEQELVSILSAPKEEVATILEVLEHVEDPETLAKAVVGSATSAVIASVPSMLRTVRCRPRRASRRHGAPSGTAMTYRVARRFQGPATVAATAAASGGGTAFASWRHAEVLDAPLSGGPGLGEQRGAEAQQYREPCGGGPQCGH